MSDNDKIDPNNPHKNQDEDLNHPAQDMPEHDDMSFETVDDNAQEFSDYEDIDHETLSPDEAEAEIMADVPYDDPEDVMVGEEAYGENDAFDEADFQDDMEDLDAFSEEWAEDDEAMFAEDENADEPASGANKAAFIQKLSENKPVKYGAMGLGGVAAVAVLYVFVLGGGGTAPSPAPMPVANNNAAGNQSGQSATQTNPSVQAALNGNGANNAEPVSLFDSLDNMPAPDPVEGRVETTSQGENIDDVFSILENNDPVDEIPAADTAMSADGVDNDFSLPMPSPIGAAEDEPNTSGASNDMAVMDTPSEMRPLSNTNDNISNSAGDTAVADIGFDIFEEPAQQMDEIPDMLAAVTESDQGGNGDTDLMPQPITAADTPSANAAAQNTAASTNAPAAASSAEMKEIQNQLTRLNDRMDDMNSRINSLENSKSSGTKTSSADLRRIESAIERLERRIEDLGKSGNVMASAAPKSSSGSSKTASAPKAEPVKKASVQKKAPAPKKRTAPRYSANNWELRGAGPNEAYIAKKGSSQIQTVRVGDNVAGLGSIKYVGLDKGQWVVKTSGGTIKQ